MVAENPAGIVEHAIQLNYVGVKDIAFHSDRLPSVLDLTKIEGPNFAIGRSDYDPNQKAIQVIAKAELSLPDAKSFVFRVELVGEFVIDDTVFPVEKVHD